MLLIAYIKMKVYCPPAKVSDGNTYSIVANYLVGHDQTTYAEKGKIIWQVRF